MKMPLGSPVMIVSGSNLFGTSLCMALRDRQIHALHVAPSSVGTLPAGTDPYGRGLAMLDLDPDHVDRDNQVDSPTLVQWLRTRGWTVLIVNGSHNQVTAAAVAAGGVGSVPRTAPVEELLHTAALAVTGQSVMSAARLQEWLELSRHYVGAEPTLARLSAREQEVLELLARGYPPKEIAGRFVVSMTTIRTHIAAIHRKLGCRSQLEAVAFMRRHVHTQRVQTGSPSRFCATP
jgi:DNA-binding NarL/FixJ family response regulator